MEKYDTFWIKIARVAINILQFIFKIAFIPVLLLAFVLYIPTLGWSTEAVRCPMLFIDVLDDIILG